MQSARCPSCTEESVATVARERLPQPPAEEPGPPPLLRSSPASLFEGSRLAELGLSGAWSTRRAVKAVRPFHSPDAVSYAAVFGPQAPRAPAAAPPDSEWTVLLIVDSIEVFGSEDDKDSPPAKFSRQAGRALRDALMFFGVPFLVCKLPIGDYTWVAAPVDLSGLRPGQALPVSHPFWARCRGLGTLVERKTVGDLWNSTLAGGPAAGEVENGRYSSLGSQKERMLRSGCLRLILLLERSLTYCQGEGLTTTVDPYPLTPVLTSVSLAQGFSVMTSPDVQGTAVLLRAITCAMGTQLAARRDLASPSLSFTAWLRRGAVLHQELQDIRKHAAAMRASPRTSLWLPSLCRALGYSLPVVAAVLRAVPPGSTRAEVLALLDRGAPSRGHTKSVQDCVDAVGSVRGEGCGVVVLDGAACAAVAHKLRAVEDGAGRAAAALGDSHRVRVWVSQPTLASAYGQLLQRVDRESGDGCGVGSYTRGPDSIEAGSDGVCVVGFRRAASRAAAPQPVAAAARGAGGGGWACNDELSRDGFEVVGAPPPPLAGSKRPRDEGGVVTPAADAQPPSPAPFASLLPLVAVVIPGPAYIRALQAFAVEAGADSISDVAGVGGRLMRRVEGWRASVDAARQVRATGGASARVVVLIDGLRAAVEAAQRQHAGEMKKRAAAAEAASAGQNAPGSRLSAAERALRAVKVAPPLVLTLHAHVWALGDVEVIDVDALAPAGGTVSAALGTAEVPTGVGAEPGVLLSVLLGMLAAAVGAMPTQLHASFAELWG